MISTVTTATVSTIATSVGVGVGLGLVAVVSLIAFHVTKELASATESAPLLRLSQILNVAVVPWSRSPGAELSSAPES